MDLLPKHLDKAELKLWSFGGEDTTPSDPFWDSNPIPEQRTAPSCPWEGWAGKGSFAKGESRGQGGGPGQGGDPAALSKQQFQHEKGMWLPGLPGMGWRLCLQE